MARWNREVNESFGQDAEDLAYPPSEAGIVKRVALGFLLPGWLVWLAVQGWLSERLYLPGKGNNDTWMTGDSARWLAVAYGGVSLFCHARWFWGLLENRFKLYEIFTAIAALMFIAGFLGSLVCALEM